MHLAPWFWLAAEMSNNFACPMRTSGSLRIPFQCQSWHQFVIAHFVVLVELENGRSAFFQPKVGLKQRATGWNWAKGSSEKHQESNWVGNENVRQMVRQKKNFSGSQNSKSNGLERNLQKLYAEVKFQMIKKNSFHRHFKVVKTNWTHNNSHWFENLLLHRIVDASTKLESLISFMAWWTQCLSHSKWYSVSRNSRTGELNS